MAVKALGLAIRLTLSGDNQFNKGVTWLFVLAVAGCIVLQMNYLNKALDLFNAAHVSALYFVFFTTFVIVASVILFKDWKDQSGINVASQISGLIVGFAGVFITTASIDKDKTPTDDAASKEEDVTNAEETGKTDPNDTNK